MVSIVDMLKRSEKFSLAFDRSMPIRFQQQFWQLIAFLDKHEITWFNDEPASDHAMCQQLLGQVWRQDCQDVVLNFETQERYLGWQVDEETDELSVIIEDVYGFRWNSLLDLETADYRFEDFEEFAQVVIKEANEILQKTPEMLPVLKEAGVVDSGGQGLVEFLQGAVDALMGKEVDLSSVEKPAVKPAATASEAPLEEKDIKFGYCTEFIVMTKEEISMEEEQKFKDFLMGIGDSIVVVADEDIIKVHVHTNHPGKAIEKGLTYGELTNMKIDNMREEHRERLNLTQAEESKPEEPRKDFGFVAVSIGQGMNDIFRELGVDYLIEGGQTMNPSTEDMLNAIEQVNAETVFILPNNKNIILAATQAQSLVEDKNVVIIPTTTVPQGISAIIGFDPEADAEENEDNMKDIIECVKTGEVTYAVRDTSINGITIKVDDIMGIDDDGIKKVGQDVEKVTLELLEEMVDEDSELISIYYGEDTTKEQAEALLEKVEETYGDCDVQLEYGGQPIYYFLLSVE